jgi:hypothetical protein
VSDLGELLAFMQMAQRSGGTTYGRSPLYAAQRQGAQRQLMQGR